jgi:thioredoxin reductase (NADPH)
MVKVKVYGADWCPMTIRSLEYLKDAGVNFDYIDVEKDAKASRWVKEHNHGLEKKPTIDVAGEILSEPTNSQLEQALEAKGIVARK